MTAIFTAFMSGVLWLFDHVIGWLLVLPKDLALIVFGILCAATLLLLRRTIGNNDLRERCKADRKRIQILCKSARQAHDTDTLKRLRNQRALVGLKELKAEAPVMLAAVPVFLLLMAWCSARLQYHPLQPGEPIEVLAWLPPSSSGELVHLVPHVNLHSINGWIQRVQPSARHGKNIGRATWTLQSLAEGSHPIILRYKNKTIAKQLYTTAKWSDSSKADSIDPAITLELNLRPVRLFNTLPGFTSLNLPPCVIASGLVCLMAISLFNHTRKLVRRNAGRCI